MREYTRDGNGYRDALIENGVVKAKFYDGSGEKNECTGVISQYEGNGMGIHDLHRHCLFRFIGGNEGTRSRQLVLFDDLLNTVEHKIISASEVMDQDRRAVKVVVEFKADHNSTYWFDTSRNFLIYREEVNYYNSTTKQQNRVVKEVQKFHHAGSGVYFPESIVVNHTVKDGKPYTKTYFNISNIRINKPIPISDMTLNFPPGSKVTNNITGKLAKVNSDGKLVDTSVDIPQPFPVSTSGAASAQPVEYEKTVEREPLLNRILPYLSLALLLSAASIFFYRRRMQRKSEQE